MRLRKFVKNPEVIECPFCGCKANNGFDCIEHADTSDSNIRDVYECPVCKKRSIRCYEFCKWEDEHGIELSSNCYKKY